ncbi:MAG: 50S ribosomal protein L15 [Robiginitomaculum sp.]|nr:MAG: 50S ribosomal protein L15 [Robiginitomaculum sp.]
MRLNELSDNSGATPKGKRLGRGPGSGKGKTAGRGVKGQKSRSGVAIKGFEGGQMPLHMRLPKRGFNKPNRMRWAELNLGRLQVAIDAKKIDAKKAIDGKVLVAAGVLRRELDGVRLLAKGTLKTKVEISVAGATPAAIAAVEKAGGKVTLPEVKAPEAKTKAAKK